MNGTITVIDKGAVRLHSYMSPADSLNVTTQIIETSNRLIVVDAQYALSYADEVAAYAETLAKPIDRVIISHAHPDHFHGAARFGAPVHSLALVQEQIAAAGDDTDPAGTSIPSADMTPTEVIEPGFEVIDGVTLEFRALAGGEAAHELVIALPEHRLLVAQDLIYNRTHLFFGNHDITGWIARLDEVALEDFDTVLPGHGLPGTYAVFGEVREYLVAAQELLGDDGDAYKAAILECYPDWAGAYLIDIGNQYLFGTA